MVNSMIINEQELYDDVVDNLMTYHDITEDRAKELLTEEHLEEIIDEMYDEQTSIMREIFDRIGRET